MKTMRCLIVDDERLARLSLRALLETIPGVEIVGEADSTERAVQAALEHKPDLLLLDVQMPGGGGFAVLRALDNPPPVVFVTAYDQYALRAFDVNAVDYLLKPVEPDRLKQALDKVGMERCHAFDKSQNSVLEQDDMVLLELGASGHFRKLTEVLAVEADGKYSKVLCSDGRFYTVRQTMKSWEERLPSAFFIRLTRSVIVNIKEIRGLDFLSRSAVVLLGPHCCRLEVGECAAAKLRRIAKIDADRM